MHRTRSNYGINGIFSSNCVDTDKSVKTNTKSNPVLIRYQDEVSLFDTGRKSSLVVNIRVPALFLSIIQAKLLGLVPK